MEYNTFENQIKNTLLRETHLVDIGALNMAIHAKKDKKRRFLIYLFSGIILGALASYLMIGGSDNTIETPIIDTQQPKNISIDNNTSISKLNNKTTANLESQSNSINSTAQSKANAKNVNNSISGVNNSKTKSKFTYTNLHKSSINAKQSPSASAQILTNAISPDYTAIAENEAIQNILQEKIHIDYLPALEYNVATSSRLLPVKDNIICPSFKNNSSFHFSIIPELGLIVPQKSLERNFGETSKLLDLRNKNESSLFGFQGTIYGMLSKHDFPVSLKVGLSYANFAERMRLDYSFIKQDTTIGIISITKSQSGDTITTIYGDIIRERKISGSKSVHHTISSIDLPIGLNIEKNLGAFTLSAGAGVYLNLSTSVSGHVLESDTSFVATDQPIALYRNNVGLSYYGELLLMRPIGRIGSIYLGARYRHIPQPFSSSTNAVKQNYALLSLNVGYVYRF